MGLGSEKKMNYTDALKSILIKIDEDLYRENGRVLHHSDDFVDFYRNVHGDFLPDDHRYEIIEKIISEMLVLLNYSDYEHESIDKVIGEISDTEIEPDIYMGDLLYWVSSNLNRTTYVDDSQSIFGYTNFEELLRNAQYLEIEETKQLILNELREMLEEIEDNQSS